MQSHTTEKILSTKSQRDQTHQSITIGELPFVDRVNEKQKILQCLEQIANSKSGGIVYFISGEAGVGKSRFAQEMIERARELGFKCLVAKCSEDSGLPPYFPWIEFIRQISEQVSAQLFFSVCGKNTDQILRLVPELSRLTGKQIENTTSSLESPKTPEDTQREEVLFLSALSEVFLKLSEESPLVLILDDLQWSDMSSIKLLSFLLSNNLAYNPILVLCLYRDSELRGETNGYVESFIQQTLGQSQGHTLTLSRFSNRDVMEVTSKLFRCNEDRNLMEFTDLLYSATGGNPLFIKETLKSLAERGLISKLGNGDWSLPRVRDKFQLPSTIRTVVQQRLGRLDPLTIETLRIAAVIGEQFEFDTLSKVAEFLVPVVNRGILSSSINAAVKCGFILNVRENSI